MATSSAAREGATSRHRRLVDLCGTHFSQAAQLGTVRLSTGANERGSFELSYRGVDHRWIATRFDDTTGERDERTFSTQDAAERWITFGGEQAASDPLDS